MLTAKLFHNPKAGDKDHSEEKLVSYIEDEGFKCNYTSVKDDGWESIEPGTDILVIAGGDGTVRKVARALLQDNIPCPYLVGLLPMGTANNIAKTLNIQGELPEIVRAWHSENTVQFDLMLLKGLPQNNFFIEGFGYGIFPQLMLDMKQVDKKKLDTPEKEIQKATEMLRDIVLSYKARYCRADIDGEVITGEFLLAEVMNIRSVGPNLVLAPAAEPGDGVLEVVLIPNDQRRQFADYLTHIIHGNTCPPFNYQSYSGKKITIEWDDTLLHADDEMIELETKAAVEVKIQRSAMKFLVP